jgi:hypothetical protein
MAVTGMVIAWWGIVTATRLGATAALFDHIRKRMGYRQHAGMPGYYPTGEGRVPARVM